MDQVASKAEDQVTVETDAGCRLRDGVVLRANIYRPAEPGPHPVLLCRTPYDKLHPRYVRIAEELALRGYVAVVQDIRGRGASGGDWAWHMIPEGQLAESRDGYDSCEWAAALPGADGQVGTWGNSYPSWLIWRMAAARPPSLKAIFTSGFSVDTLECTHGVFETGIRLRWQHGMAVSSRARSGDVAYPSTVDEANHYWDRVLRGKWLWHLPLDDVPDALFGPTAAMQRDYWRNIAGEHWALDAVHPLVEVPTCTLTGWWDRLNGAAGHYPGMVANGPAGTRSQHRLIIGPWVHDVEAKGGWTGPRSYDTAAELDLVDVLCRWYDHHLKGQGTDIDGEGPVRLFVLNDNRWANVPNWPPPGVEHRPLFLRGGGDANTPDGDGALEFDAPGSEPCDRFVYNPADPVMSLVEPDGQASACDQRPLAARRDILVYQTGPLDQDLLLAGPIELFLHAASDCPDTDFVARLIEVGEDGLAINIAQGFIRARYREGFDREVMLSADEPVELKIDLSPVGIRFRRGSRIRLDVTSSDFPTFDRNHNTGAPFSSDRELRIARQTVLHDTEHPSRLVLPVVVDESCWS